MKIQVVLVFLASIFVSNADEQTDQLSFAKKLREKKKPAEAELDLDGDKNISNKELIFWSQKYYAEYGITGIVDFDDALTVLDDEGKGGGGDWSLPLGLILRKDFDSLSQKLEKADPAQVSLIRNYSSGENTFSSQAAVGKKFDIEGFSILPSRFGGFRVDEFSFVPGISIDRIDGEGDGSLEETDVLTLGFTFSLDLESVHDTFFDYQRFSLSGKWVGDTDFEGFAPKVDFSWIPLRGSRPFALNHQYWRSKFSDKILIRNVFSLRSQIGDFVDEINDGDRFFFVGGSFGYFLKPTKFQRLEFFGNYTYFLELTSGDTDVDYLEVGARLNLSDNDNVYLEAKYRKGEELEKFSSLDALIIGLSAKF